MAITLDRQAELQGLLMGPGTPFQFETFNPWGYPDLSTGDIGRPQRHGLITGQDLMRGRRLPMVINIVQTSKQSAIDSLHQLIAAWQPIDVDVPFTFRAGSRTYMVYGRPRLADPDPSKAPAGVIRVECRFLATDPYLYAATEGTGDTTYPDPTDEYHDPYDPEYEDPLTNGRVPVTNIGTVGAPWRAEIVGPWVNPTITLLATGQTTSLGRVRLDVTVPAGETLTIDSRRELVFLEGNERLESIRPTTEWFTIPPGTFDVRFSGDLLFDTGTADLFWRSTWL